MDAVTWRPEPCPLEVGDASATVCAIVCKVRTSQRIRVRLIGFLSMAVLFAQLAVAAYICPAMGERPGTESAGMAAMAGMPCAEMMAADAAIDSEHPTLCMQHCQFGSTAHAVDQGSPAFVAVTALPVVFEVSANTAADKTLNAWARVERLRDRPPPLAHSIAHCCFRI